MPQGMENALVSNPSLLKVINLISEETIQSLYKDQRIFLGLMKIIITGEVDKRWVDMKIELLKPGCLGSG